MFKKYTKNLLEKDVTPFSSAPLEVPKHPSTPIPYVPQKQEEEFIAAQEEAPIDEPETIIGKEVSIKGELSFDKLLRIDGRFEGTLVSNGKLIVGPTGYVKSDINLEEAYISGKVEGDITIKQRLVLRGRAEIYGNITAQTISVDEGVTIVGQLCVTPEKKETELASTSAESSM